jgi:hypothetical protein
MRKSTLVLIIIISGLMFYVGCDSDNGSSGAGAPGAGVDPCAELAEAAECPCDYSTVPNTPECWDFNPKFQRCDTTQCESTEPQESQQCALTQDVEGESQGIFAFQQGSDRMCVFDLSSIEQCDFAMNGANRLTDEEWATCLCRVAQYANELSKTGVVITDSGPPFSCEPSPTPLPGGGVPPGSEEKCARCPCNYFDVPREKGCWEHVGGTNQLEFPVYLARRQGSEKKSVCRLDGGGATSDIYSAGHCQEGNTCNNMCNIERRHETPNSCKFEEAFHEHLTDDEINDCDNCILFYVQRLQAAGITVNFESEGRCPAREVQ